MMRRGIYATKSCTQTESFYVIDGIVDVALLTVVASHCFCSRTQLLLLLLWDAWFACEACDTLKRSRSLVDRLLLFVHNRVPIQTLALSYKRPPWCLECFIKGLYERHDDVNRHPPYRRTNADELVYGRVTKGQRAKRADGPSVAHTSHHCMHRRACLRGQGGRGCSKTRSQKTTF